MERTNNFGEQASPKSLHNSSSNKNRVLDLSPLSLNQGEDSLKLENGPPQQQINSDKFGSERQLTQEEEE